LTEVVASWRLQDGYGLFARTGLIIGTALMKLQQQHRQQLDVEEARLVGDGPTEPQISRSFFQWFESLSLAAWRLIS
jgi:hypothetical protein